MNRKSLLVVVSVCASVVGLVMGCGPDSGTSYRDFFTTVSTVLQADGQNPVVALPVAAFNWVVTFADGSTVLNVMNPTGGITTDEAGKFTFTSNQLNLKSGTLEKQCTTVCVDYETDYDDVCVAYDVDDDGFSYCSDYVSVPYQYCAVYGDDCDYVYPSRDITDITSAYSEITYNDGVNMVSTQSDVALPAQALQLATSTVDSNQNTTISQKWVQNDTFITNLVQASAARKSTKTATRKMAKSGTPHFGHTHKPSLVLPVAQLSPVQKAKLDAIRATAAYAKPTK